MINPQDAVIETSYQKGKRYFADSIRRGMILPCSPGFVKGSCRGGHNFASVQYCGREYCRDCSKDGSPIHQRRVNNWNSRIGEWGQMGYLVITVPEALRPFFFDREILRDFRFKVLRKLKSDFGIKKGLCRYHWFGDCENCGAQGCEYCYYTGSGDFFHPHLNILFERGYIENVSKYFAPLRSWMANYFRKVVDHHITKLQKNLNWWIDEDYTYYDHLLDIRNEIKSSNLVINYSFVTEAGEKMNRIKYITRATFKRYYSEVKETLHNFRNCIVWGWKRGEIQEDDRQENLCPVCLKEGKEHIIKWHKVEQFKNNQKLKHHDTGEIELIKSICRSGTARCTDDDYGIVSIRSKKAFRKISISRFKMANN